MSSENEAKVTDVQTEVKEKKSLTEIFHSVTSSAPVAALGSLISKAWNKLKDLGGKAKEKVHEWTAPKEEAKGGDIKPIDRGSTVDQELGLTETGGELAEPAVK